MSSAAQPVIAVRVSREQRAAAEAIVAAAIYVDGAKSSITTIFRPWVLMALEYANPAAWEAKILARAGLASPAGLAPTRPTLAELVTEAVERGDLAELDEAGRILIDGIEVTRRRALPVEVGVKPRGKREVSPQIPLLLPVVPRPAKKPSPWVRVNTAELEGWQRTIGGVVYLVWVQAHVRNDGPEYSSAAMRGPAAGMCDLVSPDLCNRGTKAEAMRACVDDAKRRGAAGTGVAAAPVVAPDAQDLEVEAPGAELDQGEVDRVADAVAACLAEGDHEANVDELRAAIEPEAGVLEHVIALFMRTANLQDLGGGRYRLLEAEPEPERPARSAEPLWIWSGKGKAHVRSASAPESDAICGAPVGAAWSEAWPSAKRCPTCASGPTAEQARIEKQAEASGRGRGRRKVLASPPSAEVDDCPITRAELFELGARQRPPVVPHEGAASAGNVWRVIQRLRTHAPEPPVGFTRADAQSVDPDAGSEAVDLALAWLVESGEFGLSPAPAGKRGVPSWWRRPSRGPSEPLDPVAAIEALPLAPVGWVRETAPWHKDPPTPLQLLREAVRAQTAVPKPGPKRARAAGWTLAELGGWFAGVRSVWIVHVSVALVNAGLARMDGGCFVGTAAGISVAMLSAGERQTEIPMAAPVVEPVAEAPVRTTELDETEPADLGGGGLAAELPEVPRAMSRTKQRRA